MLQDFKLWKRAQDSIAQGALTNSKHPHRHVFGIYPTHVRRGSGCYLFDSNNDRYVDYICGLGTNLLGYDNPKIIDRLKAVISDGISHSLPTHHEVEAAEALKQFFVFTDQWKFLKTGSEACAAAIRIARAHTGREIVLSEGYHGWSDDFVSLTEPAKGIPRERKIFDIKRMYKDIRLSEVAAIIVEPVITDYSDGRRQYLENLRGICDKNGILLIFDEIITGFRFDKRCVAQFFNINPDLICIGKAIANGLPLAAVGGKAEVMSGDYFISSTYAGEILSLVACKEVTRLLEVDHSYKMTTLWESGANFINRFNEVAGEFVTLEGYPTRGVFKGTPLNKALLFQEAARANILLCASWFYNFQLKDNDFYFFSFLTDFIERMKRGGIALKGEMPISPFAEKMRDGKT